MAVTDNMTPPSTPVDPADHGSLTQEDPPGGIRWDRRKVLIAGLGGLGLAGSTVLISACGDSGDDPDAGDTTDLDEAQSPQLVPLFPRDVAYLAAGLPSRLIFTVTDDEGIPRAELPDDVVLRVSQGDEQVGDDTPTTVHSEGIPRPYLAATFTFPSKGVYDIGATVDGVELSTPVIVMNPDEIAMPVVGDPIPSTHTPTTANSLEVDPICTLVPECPFHEHDLADVLGTGKPVVVLLATPAYCQTTACGPILENLMAETSNLPDDVIVIHAEVYKNAAVVDDLNDAVLAPLPADYKMAFEPSLFVVDSNGILAGRGDIAVDLVEMRQLLALAR